MTGVTERGRFGLALGELKSLLSRLRHATRPRRPHLYAECIPLLQEINRLVQPPLPARETKALIHETGWHLRSLAGLATVDRGTREEHFAWARDSLSALTTLSADCPEI